MSQSPAISHPSPLSHHRISHAHDHSQKSYRLRSGHDQCTKCTENAYRSSLPPSPPPTPQAQRYSLSLARTSWPPSPSVEDEGTAFAKELNPPLLEDSAVSEVRSRGSLDQQPIILEADEQARLETSPNLSTGDQNVLDCGLRMPNINSTSNVDTENFSRGRQRRPYLNTALSETPSMTRRSPSSRATPAQTSDSSKVISGDFQKDTNRADGPHAAHPPLARATSVAQPNIIQHISASTSNRRQGSRPVTPTYNLPPSPALSRRNSVYRSRDASPRSGLSSIAGSRSSSRPSSPTFLDYKRQSTTPVAYQEVLRPLTMLPVLPDDRTRPPSRLASTSLRAGSETTPKPLPYPVDDLNIMPSEKDHKYKPPSTYEPLPSPVIMSLGIRPLPVASRSFSAVASPLETRPLLNSHHTFGAELPSARGTVRPFGAQSIGTSGARSPLLGSSVSTGRNACPRIQSSSHYSDWYTLEGCPDFAICPTCVDTHFSSTVCHRYFVRASRKTPTERIKCHFGFSPWIRWAWLLTQKRRRNNLDLIHSIVKTWYYDRSCPNDQIGAREWHTLKDSHGRIVSSLTVCPRDVKKIEALMPSLRGCFVPNPHRVGYSDKCSFRVDSKHFDKYLNLLTEIDEHATETGNSPEVEPLLEFIRVTAQERECPRDTMLSDESWHFMPQLPEFTVCEECYTNFVWPEIARGSTVANQFNRTPQLVRDEEDSNGRLVGTSCQLYSPRMQRAFRNAVQSRDFSVLARRAKDRRSKEVAFRTRTAALRREAAEMRSSHRSHQRHSTSEIQAELDRIKAEWQEEWA